MNTKSCKVAVTGGAGFIGSELVRQLCLDGHEVVVIDNLVNGKPENLIDIDNGSCQLCIEDIRNSELIAKLLKGVDIVFHLACLGVRHSIHSPLENHDVNANATLKLLIAARQTGVRKFVYISSSEVYGTARAVPMTEEHPTFPMTVYGAAKLAGESYTRAFYETYSYPTVVVRPFNAYGPHCHHEGDSGEVIPKFLIRSMAGIQPVIFGDGNQTRDFTYVSDTARGILLAGFTDEAVGQTINIGSGYEVSVSKLAEEILFLIGNSEIEPLYDLPRPGDVLRLYADTQKSRDILGFEPKVDLKEGLKRLLNWYQNSGLSPEDLLKAEIVHNWKVS
ncbi:MAG: NAD-dependent epimerase/dehydratase family protein [Limnothrix sp. CACIAM 69d]|nr:MAG: NAD-dependent epimerase/dehydratase family protein [Limnothrix sp. CACIAM 69d]